MLKVIFKHRFNVVDVYIIAISVYLQMELVPAVIFVLVAALVSGYITIRIRANDETFWGQWKNSLSW